MHKFYPHCQLTTLAAGIHPAPAAVAMDTASCWCIPVMRTQSQAAVVGCPRDTAGVLAMTMGVGVLGLVNKDGSPLLLKVVVGIGSFVDVLMM